MTNEEKQEFLEVLKEAMTPVEYGGDYYNPPEVYEATPEDVYHALISAGYEITKRPQEEVDEL